jgi:NAD(P)-dependent dehydrogenase (short-subunit alcohol dehydrogenase family)
MSADVPTRLAGRVAVVTGASRGLGREIALTFGHEGAAVVVAARTEQVESDLLAGTVYETAELIRAAGGTSVAARCDVTVEDDLLRLVDCAQDNGGPVDLLVNNAAATVPGRPGKRPELSTMRSLPFIEFPLKGFRTQFEVNVFAACKLMQLVVPGMMEMGRGAVINISSDAAHQPGAGPYRTAGEPLAFAYGASKAALEHLTQSVAYEVASSGVVVNALLPSLPIPTPGLAYVGGTFDQLGSASSFAEAAVRLALLTPDVATGCVFYSDDVLHPELGQRGWLGDNMQ